MHRLAHNNAAPSSLVNASCSSNGPIKGNQPWSFVGMSQIDYLTMSKLCSQITEMVSAQTGLISNRFHTCLGFRVLMQKGTWEGREARRGVRVGVGDLLHF